MPVDAVQREALVQAQDYMKEGDTYEAKVKKGDTDATQPKQDLKLEALADVLRGKLMVQIHCYRADEFLNEIVSPLISHRDDDDDDPNLRVEVRV